MFVCTRARARVCVEILWANKNAGDTLGAPPFPWQTPYLPTLRATGGVGFKKKPSWKMPSTTPLLHTRFPPTTTDTVRFNFLYKVLTTFLSKSLSLTVLSHSLIYSIFLLLICLTIVFSLSIPLYHSSSHTLIYILYILFPLSTLHTPVEIFQGFQSNAFQRQELGWWEKLSHEKTFLLKWWAMFVSIEELLKF